MTRGQLLESRILCLLLCVCSWGLVEIRMFVLLPDMEHLASQLGFLYWKSLAPTLESWAYTVAVAASAYGSCRRYFPSMMAWYLFGFVPAILSGVGCYMVVR